MIKIAHRLRVVAPGFAVVAAFTLGLIWCGRGVWFLPGWSTWFWTLISPITNLMFAGVMLSFESFSGLAFFMVLLGLVTAIAMHPLFQKRWAMVTTIIGFVIWGVLETLLTLG
jgi:hypothetical protein